MTDKEILAELKRSYEYLRDIRENGCIDHCNGQMENNIDRLEMILSELGNIYFDFYNTLDEEDLRVKALEENEDDRIYIGSDICSDYERYDWDIHEKTFFTCADVDYYWYEDSGFLLN